MIPPSLVKLNGGDSSVMTVMAWVLPHRGQIINARTTTQRIGFRFTFSSCLESLPPDAPGRRVALQTSEKPIITHRIFHRNEYRPGDVPICATIVATVKPCRICRVLSTNGQLVSAPPKGGSECACGTPIRRTASVPAQASGAAEAKSLKFMELTYAKPVPAPPPARHGSKNALRFNGNGMQFARGIFQTVFLQSNDNLARGFQ